MLVLLQCPTGFKPAKYSKFQFLESQAMEFKGRTNFNIMNAWYKFP